LRQARALQSAVKTEAEELGAEDAAQEAGALGRKADKLLLTPALRVVSSGPETEEWQVPQSADQAEPEPATEPASVFVLGPEQGIAAEPDFPAAAAEAWPAAPGAFPA